MAQKNDKAYRFVVDCKADHCHAIQTHMRDMGFRVHKNSTSLGDHYGIKRFPTEQDANKAADDIFDEHSAKIHQIAVFPDV